MLAERERGQSEVVGTLMLTLVIVIVVIGGTGVLVTSFEAGDEPLADIAATVTTAEVMLVHQGGNVLETARLVVTLGTDDDRSVIRFGAGELSGPDSRTFEPTERWSHPASFDAGEAVTVRLVHRGSRDRPGFRLGGAPSNTTIFVETLEVDG